MIHNNTIYTKEDYLYMAKLEMRKPNNILFAFVEWVLGVLILQEAIPFLKLQFLYPGILNAEQMWYMIFCLIFGVACIIFPFLMPYIVASKTYRKADKIVEKSGVVYLRIAIDKSKVYLAAHDDSYLEGSREELLAILKRKEIEEV